MQIVKEKYRYGSEHALTIRVEMFEESEPKQKNNVVSVMWVEIVSSEGKAKDLW